MLEKPNMSDVFIAGENKSKDLWRCKSKYKKENKSKNLFI
jgi:hypothetical protein